MTVSLKDGPGCVCPAARGPVLVGRGRNGMTERKGPDVAVWCRARRGIAGGRDVVGWMS